MFTYTLIMILTFPGAAAPQTVTVPGFPDFIRCMAESEKLRQQYPAGTKISVTCSKVRNGQ